MEEYPWYGINHLSLPDTPALVVYPSRVRQNIALLTNSIDDVSRLRPHVKTHKSEDVTRLMLEAGIRKFKCATIAEAEMLARCSAPDVLLAYQPNEVKSRRLLALVQAYPQTTFACLVDNLVSAQILSELAVGFGVVVPVYVDLNVGMNRTGIRTGENALTLYAALDQLAGVKPVGLHAYDGHLHEQDLVLRTLQCDAAFLPVQQLSEELVNHGFASPIIVAGGSPTFPIHARRPAVECSPGTFVYWDKNYQNMLAEQPFLPAALVLTRVISLPGPTTLCLDVGHKSIAAESELSKRITFLNAPELRPIGQSEEHLVVEAGEGHTYRVGDVLYGLPYHICPTCALYERAFTAMKGFVTGAWRTTARDRTLTY